MGELINNISTMHDLANSPSNSGGGAVADAAGVSLTLTDEAGDQFHLLQEAYKAPGDAIVDKHEPVPGSNSLFNPFKIFKYSKFGLSDYNLDLHFDTPNSSMNQNDRAAMAGLSNGDSYAAPGEGGGTVTSGGYGEMAANFQPFSDTRRWMENPTATNIIQWSNLQTQADNTAISPTPYATTDFLWCKHYGKVPNNRMLTLRRYALPVEDNLQIRPDKGPLVPTAQAVSWYGTDIGNSLNSILGLSWGFKWKNEESKVQDIAGNEITVEQIAAAAGQENNKDFINILKSQVFSGSGGKVDILKLAGYDKEIQEYIGKAYSGDGPYWNRVLGPVNVIHKTKIRDRGFEDQTGIVLKFHYSLRSYAGINPKIAFLDLYSNFLSLTMNSAPFWGGGARYFQKTGVTLPGFGVENKMLDGDVIGAISLGSKQIQEAAQQNLETLVAFAQSIAAGKYDGSNKDKAIEEERQKLDKEFLGYVPEGETDPISKLLAPRIGQVLRKPLIYRAILDGRAVGEWHLTVGNPMNPMAVIGNLCVTKASVEFGEVLGIDDFPTEVTFTVNLDHGRPRAKQDLESIFNLGNGALGYSQLPPPPNASNSYGDNATQRLNSAHGTTVDAATSTETVGNEVTENVDEASMGYEGVTNTNLNSNISDSENAINSEQLDALVKHYGKRVTAMYGEGFGNSPILKDYFTELKTKD